MGDRSAMSIDIGTDPESGVMADKIAAILNEYGFDAEPAEIKAGARFEDDEISLSTADTIFGRILALMGGIVTVHLDQWPDVRPLPNGRYSGHTRHTGART